MPDALVTLIFVPLMVLGFGFIVAVHEFGHFIAARWARIRVHAFAVGFGQAICSYRKGFGVTRGSSAERYDRALAEALAKDSTQRGPGALPGISPTEYRLNWIPFGGYVKMLGQDDADPSYRSDAPDSYQSASILKRMVVISAGVILNVLLAAVLFIAVYTVGIAEPSNVIGEPRAGSVAAGAGFAPGDVIAAVDGEPTPGFRDVMVAVALSPVGEDLTFDVITVGEGGVHAAVQRTASPLPASSSPLSVPTVQLPGSALSCEVWPEPVRSSDRDVLAAVLELAGLPGLTSGSRLVAIDGEPVAQREHPVTGERFRMFSDAQELIASTQGSSVGLTFEMPDGSAQAFTVPTVRTVPRSTVVIDNDRQHSGANVLGLTPLMMVSREMASSPGQGLEPGDVFLRVGSVMYPSVSGAIREIRASSGGRAELIVLRGNEVIAIEASVSTEGIVGFTPAEALHMPILARTPEYVRQIGTSPEGDPLIEDVELAAERLGLDAVLPGTRVTAVNGVSVESFDDMLEAARAWATSQSSAGEVDGSEGPGLEIDARALPAPGVGPWSLGEATGGAEAAFTLRVTRDEVDTLVSAPLRVRGLAGIFRPVETVRVADSPLHAVVMGAHATKRIIQQTYLTLRRLVEGTVPVNQLQGPVGITYTGSRLAEQGPIYMLYFLALISANLAVINFLPIPITDGGQFLLLLYEAVARKPMPVVVQNILTLIGLAAILVVFAYVTFHDILRIF